MKSRMLGLIGLSVLALMAIPASNASATTLEVGGVTQNEAVTFTVSLKSGTTSVTNRTDGSLINTCTKGHLHGATQTFTGETVTAPLTTATPEECLREATVHKTGQLYVEHISGSTDGHVYWENGEATYGSPFGTIVCKTGAGTTVGTLTGVSSGHATIDINGIMNCGLLFPSVVWKAELTVTTPTGVGISA